LRVAKGSVPSMLYKDMAQTVAEICPRPMFSRWAIYFKVWLEAFAAKNLRSPHFRVYGRSMLESAITTIHPILK